MKFKKEFLQDVVCGYAPDVDIINDEIIDHSRWSVVHELIFKHSGNLYRTTYSVGATESQCESPFEYDDDEVEVTEVVAKEVTVIQYVPAIRG